MPTYDPEKANTSSPLYPEGTYKIVISKHERVTAGTGTPQIRWYGDIVEPEEHKGRTFVVHTPLTEKAMWKVATLISACGLHVTEKYDTGSAQFDNICNDCTGRTTYWYNKPELDNKQNMRNSISNFKLDTDQDVVDYVVRDDTPESVKSWDKEEN